MDLIASRWRTLLAFAAFASALVLGRRGDWAQAAVPAGIVLVPLAWWVRGELLATRAMLRGEPGAGKHRKPLVRAYACSRCGKPGVTEWAGEGEAARGQMLGLDLVCDNCLVAKLRLMAAPRM